MSGPSGLALACGIAVILACAALAVLRNAPALFRPGELPVEWHSWFAWRPVRAGGGKFGLLWLCSLERRLTASGWEYRAQPKCTAETAALPPTPMA